MDAAEEWLQKNTFYCGELDARISEAACARYRLGFRIPNSTGRIVARACQQCRRKVKAEPLRRPRVMKRAAGRKSDGSKNCGADTA